MKKYFLRSLIVTCVITTVFVFVAVVNVTRVNAQSMTISQLVELLITIGAIAPDKVVAARAVATTLSQTTTVTDVIATSTSYIQVLTPNGGQSWDIDLDIAQSITWGSSGLTQVRVALVSTAKNIGTCELSQLPVASKNGNHEFKTLLKTAQCYNLSTGTSTPLVDGTYKARIYYTDAVGTTISDDSDATFKILPKPIPSIKVTYPNGGDQLVRNREYEVKYKLTNVTNVVNNLIYLYLLDSNGSTAYNSHKVKRTDGTYSLDLPSSLSAGAYKIKLVTTTSDDKVEIEDISDNFFWISTGL